MTVSNSSYCKQRLLSWPCLKSKLSSWMAVGVILQESKTGVWAWGSACLEVPVTQICPTLPYRDSLILRPYHATEAFSLYCVSHGAEGKDQIFHDQITKRNFRYTVFKFSLNWILIFSLIWLHCYDFTWCLVFTNKNTLHSLMKPWNVKLVDEQACFYFILNMQEWFAVLQL